MLGGIGTTELIIILVIVIVIFGGSRLPELGKGIGQAIKNFKKASSEPDEIDVTPKKKVEQSAKKEGEPAEEKKEKSA